MQEKLSFSSYFDFFSNIGEGETPSHTLPLRTFNSSSGTPLGGKGSGQSDKKALTTIFLVLSLFYRSQMVNFKEIYRFSRLQMGSNFFQRVQLFPGGVQLLILYRNPFNL